ncbi:hypothetical protein BOX15_Mlig018820g2 [Macrostomum lignano]|uniref:DUF3504 domain-containing protein n=1 Tax=Macrostomum lignano TaxID=282301 RepID=A0A267DHV8_9PLAT|nr:hypothetical protein BOX15_Mlig018820g1 [Macrostomum lignano]PAA74740.1 hypothetical protein BOX15_Mlig018820g2 [Macrostomum lignano]
MKSIQIMPLRYVDSYLRLWYVNLKIVDQDGERYYAPDRLRCFRASIHRYLRDVRGTNLIGDDVFRRSNQTYNGMLRSIGDSFGYRAITASDMDKLCGYFDKSNPQKLQDEIFFLVMYHFGFRGRESIRALKKSDLIVSSENGVKCVDLVKDGAEKTITERDWTDGKQFRLFATDDARCPVAAVEMYLSKVPQQVSVLFPKPLKIKPGSENW